MKDLTRYFYFMRVSTAMVITWAGVQVNNNPNKATAASRKAAREFRCENEPGNESLL